MVPQRRWGQNFLVDSAVFDRITALATVLPATDVLEIGPGPGGLTVALLTKGVRVLGLEVDPRAKILLQPLESLYPGKFFLVMEDALRASWGGLQDQWSLSRPLRIVGNLPYYITGPLLAKLTDDPVIWDRAVVMVQQEVAERLLAPPGDRNTSALGVMLRYVADVRPGLNVGPDAFYPTPEVSSAVVQLIRRDPPEVPLSALRWAVGAGFRHRRKMLRQALAMAPGSPWGRQEWNRRLAEAGLDASKRAEALTWEEWIVLAGLIPGVMRERGDGGDFRESDQGPHDI